MASSTDLSWDDSFLAGGVPNGALRFKRRLKPAQLARER
jgi:hypothetical protein